LTVRNPTGDPCAFAPMLGVDRKGIRNRVNRSTVSSTNAVDAPLFVRWPARAARQSREAKEPRYADL
jgi:hypothetical protein